MTPPFNVSFSRLLILFVFFSCSFPSFAQGGPPGDNQTLSVTSSGSLNFGRFSRNIGGTITIDLNGTISATGDIFILNSPPSPVFFNVSTKKGNDRLIVVTASATPLTGAGSLELSVFFNQTSFILNKTSPALIQMGGTLTVGQEDLPGIYAGIVSVNFAYQ